MEKMASIVLFLICFFAFGEGRAQKPVTVAFYLQDGVEVLDFAGTKEDQVILREVLVLFRQLVFLIFVRS